MRKSQFSPDGWVAYQSNVTGSFEIYVQPFQSRSFDWVSDLFRKTLDPNLSCGGPQVLIESRER